MLASCGERPGDGLLLTVGNTWGIVCIRSIRRKEVNEVLDYADMLGHKVEQTAAGHKWGSHYLLAGPSGVGVVDAS